jgi:hypothetical protein
MKKRELVIFLVLGLFIVIPVANAEGCHRVFVTNSTWQGNLGGLAGADQKCQNAASTAGLGGTWKAWISDSIINASQRLNHSIISYMRMSEDGTVIANNWNDLTDGTLQHSIDVNEYRSIVPISGVWTGTDISGSATSIDCNGWTSSEAILHGTSGLSSEVDYYWTGSSSGNGSAAGSCSNLGEEHLYCFEQTVFNNGTIKISSSPPGATIWDNGIDIGFVTPKLRYSVVAGSHTIVLKKNGYYDSATTVQVGAMGHIDIFTNLILAPWCTDSDGGPILNIKGTTIDSTGASGTDTCTKNGPLLEYYCDQNKKLTSTMVDCGGYICTGGKCLYNSPIPHGVPPAATPTNPSPLGEGSGTDTPLFNPSKCNWWQNFLKVMGFKINC